MKEVKAKIEYLEEQREAIETLCYYPDDVLSCEELIQVMDYIKQLETNWNELKKFINSGYYDSYIYSSTILKKMQELEGENNNEEESNSK